MSQHKTRSRNQGFTIIELLIATLIFTFILVGVTASIMRFSKEFHKGGIVNSTQSAARTVMDEVVRSIQFNGGGVTPIFISGVQRGYCIGDSKRYSYVLGQAIDGTPNHALVSDTVTGCGALTTPLDVTTMPVGLTAYTNGREHLINKMRVSNFLIEENNDMYTITLKLVYGDDDVLNNPAADTAACKLDQDSLKYCAVAELTTTVAKRVPN